MTKEGRRNDDGEARDGRSANRSSGDRGGGMGRGSQRGLRRLSCGGALCYHSRIPPHRAGSRSERFSAAPCIPHHRPGVSVFHAPCHAEAASARGGGGARRGGGIGAGRGQPGHCRRRGAAGAQRSASGGGFGDGCALVLAAPRGAVHGRQRRQPDDSGFPDFPTPDGQPEELGEVVISYPQAKRQARQARRPVAVEVETLVVHGVLHLLGYDHAEPDEEREMFALQDAALALAGAETAR